MAETEASTTTTVPTPVLDSLSYSASSGSSSSKPKTNFSEVQETVSRLAAHKGVTAVLILNQDGDILTQTTGTTTMTEGIVGNAKLLKNTLQAAARYIQSIPNHRTNNTNKNDTEPHESTDREGDGPFDNISFIRIRSNREEILVAPKNQYVLVVLQDPTLATL